MRKAFLAAAAGFATLGAMSIAQAATCFRACLTSQLTSPSIEDEAIRSLMKGCRDTCEAEAHDRLSARGLDQAMAVCIPEPLVDADLKKVRSASPSILAYANAFTWDLNNILVDKVIVRIEVITQNLSLQDVVMSAGGTILPGDTATILVSGFYDGYPSMRVTTRVKAIYACDVR